MPSMQIPGYLREKIQEALIAAFVDKGKLERMLDYQFNISLATIANGENNTEIVYKVIKYFQSRDKLLQLITTALKENSGNIQLKEANAEYKKIVELINILINIDIKTMQQVYLGCCPQYQHQDWDDELPDSIANLLNKLNDIPQGNATVTAMVQFVAGLVQDKEITESTAKKLQQWGEKYANNFSQLLNQSNCDTSTNIPSYLIFYIEKAQQYPGRYHISAWFLADGRKNAFNCQTGVGYREITPIAIDKQEESEKPIFAKEIPNILKLYFQEICDEKTFSLNQTTIEFFLPYELVNEPIDTWIVTADEDDIPVPIGSDYRVMIRSSKRLNKYARKNDWQYKWQLMQQRNCPECFIAGDGCSQEELYSKINAQSYLALQLFQPLSKEYFQVINQTAIPAALWLRQEFPNQENLKIELAQILEGSIVDLPLRLKQKRLQDFWCKTEQRIGHHLALLWENPDILPPLGNG